MEDLNSSDTFSVKKHLIPSQLQTITVILALHPAEMMKARAPYPPPPPSQEYFQFFNDQLKVFVCGNMLLKL